jgi:hypothetical protein
LTLNKRTNPHEYGIAPTDPTRGFASCPKTVSAVVDHHNTEEYCVKYPGYYIVMCGCKLVCLAKVEEVKRNEEHNF